nr:VWA domain-containing protein [Methanocaldococcus lauensis]
MKFKVRDNIYRYGSGRHIKSYSKRGRYIKFKYPKGKVTDIAFDATFRKASIKQKERRKKSKKKLAIYLEKEDLMEKVREKKISSYILFVVDASGSMGAMRRMEAAKGAIVSLLLDAYQKRNKIGMIAFRKDKAELILPFTSSVELGEKLLKDLPTGGKTPLADAFVKSYEVFDRELRKNPNIIPIMIVISDFKPNVAISKDYIKEVFDACEKIAEREINVVLIDTEPQSFIKIGIGKELADRFGFKYYKIDDLSKDTIVNICKDLLN